MAEKDAGAPLPWRMERGIIIRDAKGTRVLTDAAAGNEVLERIVRAVNGEAKLREVAHEIEGFVSGGYTVGMPVGYERTLREIAKHARAALAEAQEGSR